MIELQNVRVIFYTEDGIGHWTVNFKSGKRGTKITNSKHVYNIIKEYLTDVSKITNIDIYSIKYAVIINEDDDIISESEIHVDRLCKNICRHAINIYNNFTVKREQFEEWHNKYSKNIFLKLEDIK